MGSLGRYSDASDFCHSVWWFGGYSSTFIGEWCFTVWMYNKLPLHPPVHGLLNCFQFVAVVHKPAVSVHRQLCVDVCFHFS